MSTQNDFYALLSSLLQQTAHASDSPPVIPLKRWPAGSPERRILEDLLAALAALQTSSLNHPSQADERERQYQSIFEKASDGLIINGLETGLVVEANPAACKMYGYAREEGIGRPLTRFVHPDSSEQFSRCLQAVQSQGIDVAQQVHRRRDSSIFYVELSGTVYTDQQGRSVLLSVVR